MAPPDEELERLRQRLMLVETPRSRVGLITCSSLRQKAAASARWEGGGGARKAAKTRTRFVVYCCTRRSVRRKLQLINSSPLRRCESRWRVMYVVVVSTDHPNRRRRRTAASRDVSSVELLRRKLQRLRDAGLRRLPYRRCDQREARLVTLALASARDIAMHIHRRTHARTHKERIDQLILGRPCRHKMRESATKSRLSLI